MNFMYNVRALYIKFVVLYFKSNIIFQIYYNPLHKQKYTVNRSGVFIAEQPEQLPHQFEKISNGLGLLKNKLRLVNFLFYE